MRQVDADFNLLFGLLAFEKGLIDRTMLVDIHHAWLEEVRGVDTLLLERGYIDEGAHASISSLALTILDRRPDEPTGDSTVAFSNTIGPPPAAQPPPPT